MTDQSPNEPTNPYPEQPATTPAGAPAGQQPYGQGGGFGIQQKPISPAEERTLGAVAHGAPLVAMVISAGTLGFVASLVIYLMYKDRGPFIRANAANSLNIQIFTVIVLLVSIPLMFVLVGFLTFGLAFVYAFVMHLLGAIKANNGEWWEPPMTPKFVR